MTLAFAPEIYENIRQTPFKEEEETVRYSFLTSESQPRMVPKAKLTFGIADFLTDPDWEDRLPFPYEQEQLDLGFNRPPKPWLSPRLIQKLEKMKKTGLKRGEMVDLIETIAKISVDFYQIRPRMFIAVKFDGRIVESADNEIDLLLKVQGKKFDIPVFVWQAGSESFSGWRT